MTQTDVRGALDQLAQIYAGGDPPPPADPNTPPNALPATPQVTPQGLQTSVLTLAPSVGARVSASKLWMLEQQGGNEEAIRALEAEAAAQIRMDPILASNLQHWASAVPTLPGGALISLATSGVTPDTQLGQWLVRSAVPALAKNTDWKPPDVEHVADLLSDPSRLAMMQGLPIDQQTHLFAHGPWNVGKLSDKDLQHLVETGQMPDPGWTGYIGDVTRPVFAGLSAGYEAGQGLVRRAVAGTVQDVQDLMHGETPSVTGLGTSPQTGGGYIRPESYQIPGVNLPSAADMLGQVLPKFATGSILDPKFKRDVFRPFDGYSPNLENAAPGVHTSTLTVSNAANDIVGQTELGQMIRGKNAGAGIFPGGAAAEAAVKIRKAAASIDGHALTPGRAVASLVSTPGTTSYNVGSGLIDFYAAMKGDPSALALSELGHVASGAKVFATTTPEAVAATADRLIDNLGPEHAGFLKAWAGAKPGELYPAIVDKLTRDPGSAQQLVEHGVIDAKGLYAAIAGREVGLVDGLRRMVDPQTSLTFLNSPTGVSMTKRMAGMNGTDIYLRSGRKISPDIAWQLGENATEDAVRATLADHIGTDMRGIPKLQMSWTHPFEDMRYFARMPNYAVDSGDVNQMVERGISELQAGKVPKAEWDNLLRPLATSENRTQAWNAYKQIGNRIGDEILNRLPHYQENVATFEKAAADLERTGVETPEYRQSLGAVNEARKAARKLTTYFQTTAEEDRQWWVTAMGDKPHVPGLSLDGNATPIDGPYGPAELLNRGIPVIGGDGINGIREIKRAVSIGAPLWRAPYIGAGARNGLYAADFLTGAFKVGALLKLALPVRFLADEQARMASAGVDSAFHNPMSFIAWVTGKKGAADITGTDFIDMLAGAKNDFSRAVGRTGQWREELANTDRIFAKGWASFSPDHPNYNWAWADRLSHTHADDVGREVARAIVDPEAGALDALKAKFSSGKGALNDARLELIDANLGWGSANLTNRAQADAYIDGWVTRLHDITGGGNDELMHAVADGSPWRGEEANSSFKKLISKLANEGRGPDKVVGPIPFEGGKVGMTRRATNAMFSVLMTSPTGDLTRSPAFRQFYFQRVQELLPHLDDATRGQVISRAAENGITLRDVPKAAGQALSLEHADMFAKSFALQSVHDLLYYPGIRNNAVDMLRNIIPFGNAWKNVLSVWARQVAEHPQVIRRVQQGVTEARQSGWWFKDPADGIEKFTLVPGSVMKNLTGVPFPMVGDVKGLNIAAQGIPGVGPVVQWPASQILSTFHGKIPAEEQFRKVIMPYGDPDFSGGAFETLFPAWVDKLRTGGFLGVMGPSQDQKRIFDNVAKQAFEYQMSTGKYDVHDKNVLAQVWDDARSKAKSLYFWRGMAQFAAPAAPQYIAQAQLKDGALVEQWVVADDYRKMIKLNQGDDYAATLQFIDKYGPDLIFATQPYTRTTNFGIPTTAEGQAWASQNPHFAKNYPQFYGYWTPSGGAFDREVYLKQIADGTRKTLSGAQWYELATARIGNAIYDNARRRLPASPTAADRMALATYKTKLTEEFPGFNQDGLKLARDTSEQAMLQLKQAMVDPAVKNTPLAHAIVVYMHQRDRALDAARSRGYTTLTGNAVEDIRQKLFRYGTQVATKMPEFTSIWNDLLSTEVNPDG